MSIILKHILKNIKEKKMRSLIIIISLTLSAIVLTFCLTLKDNIMVKYEEFLSKAVGTADISISKENNMQITDLDKLSKNNYISVPYLAFVNDKTYIYGANIEDLIKIKLFKSNLTENLKDDEVVIAKKLAEKKNINKGDNIELFGKKYKVADIVEEHGLFISSGDAEIYMVSLNEANKINYNNSDETVQSILGKDKTYISAVYVDVLNDDIESAKEELKSVDNDFILTTIKANMEDALNTINALMILMLAITTLIAFYIINSILKLILEERIVVIGTFRSIGASRKMTNSLLYLENSVYAIISIIIGIFIGNLLIGPISDSFISTGNLVLTAKASIKPLYIVIVAAFTLFIQFTITFFQIRKTNKMSIKDIIFDTQDTKYKLKKRKVVMGICIILLSVIIYFLNTKYSFVLGLIPVILLIVGCVMIIPAVIKLMSKLFSIVFKNTKTAYMACKNVADNKVVISNTILIFIIISMTIFIYNISVTITNTYAAFDKVSHYTMRLTAYGKEEDFTYLKDVEGVKEIANYYIEFGYYKVDDKEKMFALFGYDKNDDMIMKLYNSIAFNKEEANSMNDDEIILDEAWATKNGYKVGETIKINCQQIEDKNHYFKIIGVCDSTNTTSARCVGMITKNKFKEIYRNSYTILINSDLEDNVMEEKLQKAVDEHGNIDEVFITTYDKWIEEDKKSTSQIMNIVYIVMMLGIGLAMIGLINNGLVAFSQRKKGFAVLNSTCMSKGQLYKMALEENIFSFLIAILPAISLSYFLNIFITKTLSGMDMFINMVFSINGVLTLSGIILVLMLVEALVPIIKLKKMNIVKEIKYE